MGVADKVWDDFDQPTQVEDVEWSDPIDFFGDDRATQPVLERRHVPDALWPFIVDVADRMGVDPASVALCALTACASAMSEEWAVQPKRADYEWTEQPRIWGAIIGDPSILKTPVIRACTKPLDKIEAEARKRYAEQKRIYDSEVEQAKQNKEPCTATPPRMQRYMIEDITTETLGEVLRNDGGSIFEAPLSKVLCRQDEMSEFFANLDRYRTGGKGGGERGAYLRLYNGGSTQIDRIGRGAIYVPHWSACFLGGIQPGPIQRLARETADDGLLQRLLFAVSTSPGDDKDQAPDRSAIDEYNSLFPILIGLRPSSDPSTKFPLVVKMASGAHAHREAINQLAKTMAVMPDTSKRLVAAFGKWPGMFARLCLIYHLIEIAHEIVNGCQGPSPLVISEQNAERVATYMRVIILPHLLKADDVMFHTAQTGHSKWIANLILSKQMSRITVRDVVRAYKALRAPEHKGELISIMDSLVAVAWLYPEERGSSGVTSGWIVNPAVHAVFETRAKDEAVRRHAVKRQITDKVVALHQGKNYDLPH